jgi:DNA-binding transcriptional ArsR family regulator
MEAIANPRRRQILRLVWDAERSAGEIAATSDVSWPAVSQNLRVLKNSGLLTERRAGTHRYYRVDRRALGPLEAILRQMWTTDLGRLKQLAEQEARERRRRHD